MGMPYDDGAIDEEAKKKEVVKNYLMEKWQNDNKAANKNIKSAQDQKSVLDIANIGGSIMNQMGNSRKRDSIYYNGFNNLSATPKILEAEDTKYDSSALANLGKEGVASAQNAKKMIFDDVEKGQKIQGFDRTNRINERDDAFTGKKQDYQGWQMDHTRERQPRKDEAEDSKMAYDTAKNKNSLERMPLENTQQDTDWGHKNTRAEFEDSKNADKLARMPLENSQQDKDWKHKNTKSDFEDAGMDPASKVSTNARLLYQNVLLNKAQEADFAAARGVKGAKEAAAQIRGLAKTTNMSSKESYDSLKMIKDMSYNDMLDTIEKEKMIAMQGKKVAAVRARDIDPMVQKAAKDLSSHQAMQVAFGDVDKALGAPLDSFRVDGNQLYGKDGKKVDLPGVSIPGLGRVSGYSSGARAIQGAASRVFNTVLKDRSGGSVTDGEMERLKTEFESGKFNTEADLVKGMQDYKRAAVNAMKNAEAGYSPEVLGTYRSRGGQTLQDYNQRPKAPSHSQAPAAKTQSGAGGPRRIKSIDDLFKK